MTEARALVRAALTTRIPPAEVEALGDHDPLHHLGLDSVALIALVAELQQNPGVQIEDEAVFAPDLSIASLAEAVAASGKATETVPGAEVAGLGVVAPTGYGVEALWRGLLDGEAHRVPSPYERPRPFQVGVLPGARTEEITGPGRLVSLLVLAAEEALADAGTRDRAAVHLVVGTTDTGGNALTHALDGSGDEGGRAVDEAFVGTAARRGAAALGLGGSATVVGSASAAGAVALGHALDLLRAGEAEEVLVAGVDTISETGFHGLAALRTLGPQGCRPFSSERRGIGISEAAAAVLLRRTGTPPATAGESGPSPGPARETGSPAPVRGRLAGYGASSLTTHLASPEAAGIELAVRRALDDAGLEPSDISFVNAHGPGTRLGDAAEADALRAVFGAGLRGIPLGSSKGVLWHCQGAAGVIESQVCLLSLARGVLTPTIGAEPLDPRFADLDIVREVREFPAVYALSVSCGLGGVNTALVWERS